MFMFCCFEHFIDFSDFQYKIYNQTITDGLFGIMAFTICIWQFSFTRTFF